MNYHMSPEEFRRHGYKMVDWIANYLGHVEEIPIYPEVEPGEIRKRLPDKAPERPEPFEEVMNDLDEIVMPGIMHWQSPGWFAFFPANSSPPSILGEMASAGLAIQGMLWSTSPACTEIESHVLDWLVDLLGLPATWKTAGPGGGVIQSTASDATHTALVAARYRAGGSISDQVVYASSEAHSSIEKGARIAGFEHIRSIKVDGNQSMDTGALIAAVTRDINTGLRPVFVNSTVGTTGTGGVDPVLAIGSIAHDNGMWHHVDAAWAGSTMICPEFRNHQKGLELVDSYVFNPHKLMFTNLDCSVFFIADRTPLTDVMRILPPYLSNTASASDEVIDYRDWNVPLGRRFRALKLWFVLRSYGAEGIRHHIREHVRLATELEKKIESHPSLELIAPRHFSLLSFRHVAGDKATGQLVDTINESKKSYVTTSSFDGRLFIRISIGQTRTAAEHVDRLWKIIKENAATVNG